MLFGSKRTTGIFFLLVNVVTWGAALPIVKPAFDTTTPFRFLFYRYLAALLLSVPILLWFVLKNKQLWKTVPLIIGLEILGTTLSLALLYEGLARTSALEASLLVTTTPIFTTLGGIWWLNEKEERREIFGLFLALLGTVFLALEPVFTGRMNHAGFSLFGNLLVFAQNIVIAAYFVLAKKYYQKIPKLFVTTISFYVGALSFGLLSFFHSGSLRSWTHSIQLDMSVPSVQVAVIYMALFGSIIGLTAYIHGQSFMEASEASLFSYLQPLVYIPLAWILLGEQLTPAMICAVAVISCGVLLAQTRVQKKQRRTKKKRLKTAAF